MKNKTLIIISILLLSACSGRNKETSTVRICQGDICSIKDKNTVTAVAGSTNAQPGPIDSYHIALRYFSGNGVNQDSYQAIKALTRAAEGGHHPAQKALGEIYLYGMEEMGSDPAQAERWLSAAAVDGDPEINKLLQIARKEKRDQQEQYDWEQRRKHFYHFLYNSQPYHSSIIIKNH